MGATVQKSLDYNECSVEMKGTPAAAHHAVANGHHHEAAVYARQNNHACCGNVECGVRSAERIFVVF
ncbi:hypothetical protein QYF36_008050 [Acer negundo]|nr:hypothetical protein QYF36_008050 [Acer negundo]